MDSQLRLEQILTMDMIGMRARRMRLPWLPIVVYTSVLAGLAGHDSMHIRPDSLVLLRKLRKMANIPSAVKTHICPLRLNIATICPFKDTVSGMLSRDGYLVFIAKTSRYFMIHGILLQPLMFYIIIIKAGTHLCLPGSGIKLLPNRHLVAEWFDVFLFGI